MTTLAELDLYYAETGMAGAIRRFRRNRLALVGGFFVIALIAAALVGPTLVSSDPNVGDITQRHQGPSLSHPLGTDFLGRDQLARLILGARTSLSAAFVLMLIIISVSTVIGMTAGYFGGLVDVLLMRAVDVVLAFPTLVLALAIAGFLGPGLTNALIALALVWWAGFARIIRGQVLAVRNRGFIEAAEAAAGTRLGIIRRHVLPNVASTIVVLATLDIGAIILALAGLSFLGLGVQPPAPEWGRMLFDAKPYLERQPLEMLLPGATIALAVLSFNLLGDGLRDAFDPSSRIT